MHSHCPSTRSRGPLHTTRGKAAAVARAARPLTLRFEAVPRCRSPSRFAGAGVEPLACGSGPRRPWHGRSPSSPPRSYRNNLPTPSQAPPTAKGLAHSRARERRPRETRSRGVEAPPPPPAPKSSRALDRLFGSSAAMATARAPLRCQPTPRLTRASVRRGLDRHLDGHAPAGASTDQICSALLLLVPWLSRATYARTRAVNKKTASYMDMSPKNEHESKE